MTGPDLKGPKRRYLTPKQKAAVYEREGGVCYLCSLTVAAEEAEYDHKRNRWITGDQRPENYFPVHPACHLEKTRPERRAIAKVKRILKRAAGLARPKRPILSRGFDKSLKRTMAGKVVPR